MGAQYRPPGVSGMVQLVKAKDLAKMKNDHNNAFRRASEIEDYLKAVQDEIDEYVSGREGHYPFVQATYQSLQGHFLSSPKAFPVIMRNIEQLIDGRLLPDVRLIKEDIQKAQYKDCKKKVSGYANA